jgi:non-canonical purine NTP pyrophosphatase (RdgB/HAM1 family)
MELLFATSNPHKVAQLQALLDHPVRQIDLDLPEIQAVAVCEVIGAKARAAYQIVGQPVLVEDTGLALAAWGGLPGALIRWFLKTVGNEGICQMLAGFADRRASAEKWVGYFDGTNLVAFGGVTDGEITVQPRGEGGFGWDAIFLPAGSARTFGEMTVEETMPFTMRRKAVDQLRAYLAETSQQR